MVPLTMPMMRLIGSPTSDSRSGRMNGIPATTAASYSRSTPLASATSANSLPTLASSSLLAVTTGLPAFNAATINSRAGSMPPINSTTRSTAGSATTSAASVVTIAGSSATPRSLDIERTATRTTRSLSPVRVSMSSPCASINSISAAPTLPAPSTPTVTSVEVIP